jgi:HD-GYP domain-containing protein (c-di-GMP phosphodiesterase class II)
MNDHSSSDLPTAAVPQGVTVQFERFVIVLISSFTVFRLTLAFVDPSEEPIPDEITLSVTLGLLMYMWVRVTKSRARLEATYKDLRTAHFELEAAQVDTIAALVNSVEAKDAYTHGHSERVQRTSVALARKLKLNEDVVQLISRSAVLHDIGKLGVADSILHKDGPLTAGEWTVLKEHPGKTRLILSAVKSLSRETQIAAMHHERYDGNGYLSGARGDQIPLETTIIAIADSFDAMNSDRPYRKALARDQIVAELKKSRNQQYPAAVVDAFLGLIEEEPGLWTNTASSIGTPRQSQG